MTVATEGVRVTYFGNGSTTTFAYPFPILSTPYLLYTDASGVQTVLQAPQYQITGVGTAAGGVVTFSINGSPMPSGSTLTIMRDDPYTQLTALSNQGGMWPAAVEGGLDALQLQIQTVDEEADRAIVGNPADSSLLNYTLPPAAIRAGQALGFDAQGNVTLLPPTGITSPNSNSLHDVDLWVEDVGAIGDGVTDDTAAIQTAINQVGARGGGVVRFRAKRYVITNTLGVGNGSASGVSTYSAVRLVGAGPAWMPPQFFTGYNNTAGTTLLWKGITNGTMVLIAGPLQGWGVSDMALDGAPSGDFGGVAGRGLDVVSAMNGRCTNLTIRACRDTCLYSRTVPAPPGVGIADSLANVYENLSLGMGWVVGSKGVVLTGGGPGVGPNTDYNLFLNLSIAMPSFLNSYAIYLQQCDSNVFINPHIFNGLNTAAAVNLDHTVNPDWPCGNQIINPDWGGLLAPVIVGGTPSVNARPNFVSGIDECNGALYPTDIPNMSIAVQQVAAHREHVVGPSGSRVLATVRVPGLYRVSYYVVMSAGGIGPGNVSLSISWLDGFGTPAFTSAPVLFSPGTFTGGSVVMSCQIPSQLLWQLNLFNGAVGTQCDVLITAERLM